MRWFLSALCGVLIGIGSSAAGSCDEAEVSEQGLPTVLVDDALASPLKFAASDGAFYYLSDLTFPEAPHAPGQELSGGRQVFVKALVAQKDRWGRLPAILLDHEMSDLSGKLVEGGLAIVKPQLRAFNCLKFLINLESEARRKNVGLWVVKNVINDYKSISYEQIGLYGLVEASVISVGQTRSKTYLNFGERWTEDLTGIIQRGKLADFSEFGHDLSVMKGKRVRLRGVLQLNQGPQIELKHPAQLELLD